MEPFVHLHTHTEYSILDGLSSIPKLVEKAVKDGMPGIAITDHGVMYGIKEFFDEVRKVNKILEKEGKQPFKPILGCEMYVAKGDMHDKSDYADRGNHLIVLAKNYAGYKNLIRLVSLSWTEGFYYHPRIDKASLKKYHVGLIVCSACIGGEVAKLILAGRIDAAKSVAIWYKQVFGDDYYLEMQRNKANPEQRANQETYPKQEEVNQALMEMSKELGIKLVCSNDVHFVEEEDAEAHDHLICISTGKCLDDTDRMLYTKQEWLKTTAEMNNLFADVPEALRNTMEILGKVEAYSIEHAPLMPVFPIPEEFGTEEEWRQRYTDEELYKEFTSDENGENPLPQEDAEEKIAKLGGLGKLYRIKLEADYLAKLAYEGAARLYPTPLSKEVADRIKFELHIMKTMGFPGYFLIVQDFINVARTELDVMVGPGRGSAAGSVVAYCLGITKIDPLKYDLLFERFLNPDRISLPDIDTDFDDEGRDRVLQWVTNKYGQENCSRIVTYGTMATKNSIKDMARVEGLQPAWSNALCKAIPEILPDGMKMTIPNAIKCVPELQQAEVSANSQEANVIKYAKQLEGTVRNVGVHACGFIICNSPISNLVPLSTIDDKKIKKRVNCTQYDGHVIESTGLIKMDFLGLKTLSVIKTALGNIKQSLGIDIDIDNIPLDDAQTYRLYQKGRTVGTFQFESRGMQKYLIELHPTVFEDLIAMNALYRPGPLDSIPSFIARKNGREPITYDLPCVEKYLKDTYGITVYQEQVMLLVREIAGFTRGDSDKLRKAIAKKDEEILRELKPQFIAGGIKNGYAQSILEKIWGDWNGFASYAFNKSHAVCYSWLAYQTAYLKAHYPAEYMSAVLCHTDDADKKANLIQDCKAMKISVKGADVNESYKDFAVNQNGDICMGLSDVKGVGDKVAEAIISERNAHGPFDGIFDFVERVPYTTYRGKTLDMLATGGAFSSFTDIKPQDWLAKDENGDTPAQMLQRYGEKFQKNNQQYSGGLFGGEFPPIPRPQLPQVPVATPSSQPATGTDTKNSFTCKVVRVVYHDSRSGRAIMSVVKGENDKCSVIGNIDKVEAGDTLHVYGSWKKDEKYGWQFLAKEIIHM